MKKIKNKTSTILLFIAIASITITPLNSHAQSDESSWGIKFRIGGRYDNMRMCVASPAGAKGGMAADISIFKNFNINENTTGHLDIPIMRPILFGTAFKMIQFEPSFNLRYKKVLKNTSTLVFGPGIGVSVHYGPDYKAEETLANGENSFFALGPMISGYLGFIPNREKPSKFEFGITPYFTPLFSINDSQNRNGIIAGGFVDIAYKF